MQLFSKWICRFLKGDEEKKEGEESGIHSSPPQTAGVCTCLRVCVCVYACGHVCACVFLKIFTFCFLRPTLFLEMALNTKSMKNAYSLFLRIPLFTLQTPEGPFLLLSGRHRRSGCLTGPREAGERKEEPMGCFRWGGILLSSPQLLASASLLSNAIPASPSLTHTDMHIHTDAHTWRNSGFNQGPPWEREKGPKPLEALRMLGFPKWGYVLYVCAHRHTLSHTRLFNHTTPRC